MSDFKKFIVGCRFMMVFISFLIIVAILKAIFVYDLTYISIFLCVLRFFYKAYRMFLSYKAHKRLMNMKLNF